MTTAQYLAALRKLGLTPHSQAAQTALGLSPRQLARLAAGENISQPIALLLSMYLDHGLPKH